ncbi:uncharacterized protein LOC123534602 [Mercenaria mercenaria]|uniref:uncharacterized protein LOC123534602 n=1 Tax=Mercenaria mercenaria TaxID=6596 RepID=UPI00234F26BE|nr:uncharacterized protein LOC123534602 [Mercenaria mercenaria]
MNTIFSVVCFAAIMALSSAHMCLINPHQRGSMMGLNKAGSDDCILLTGPCGGRAISTPTAILNPGKNTTVTLQKNLDHWAKATPGYFAVTIMQGTMMKEIGRVMDMGEPSLHLYSVEAMVPTGMTIGGAVLQATYVTNNSQAPAVFYQCADVKVEM